MIVRLVRGNQGSHERTTPIGTVPETATAVTIGLQMTVQIIVIDERTVAPMPMASTPNGSGIIEAISLAVGSMDELSIGPSRMAMPIEAVMSGAPTSARLTAMTGRKTGFAASATP